MRPEDLNQLSPEEKRALLVQLLKQNAPRSRSLPEDPLQRSGRLNHLAVNVADLSSEAVLDPTIRVQPGSFQQNLAPASIFLTGATGFLGAFLLRELLDQTSADLHCLVRCASLEEGKARIERNLTSYFPDEEVPVERVLPVPGDLSRPLLGLSATMFQQLAEKIDSIYHGGALVNWLYPYERLKPTNVLGTQEVLRLACQSRPKPLHFISSISVFPLFSETEGKVIYEGDSLDHGGVLYSGYAQSKWVAEKLVALAKDNGLPVAIYRPGLIIGHSKTGAWNTDDVTCNMIKSWIEVGFAPVLEAATDMTPVDYVSQAIVHLSRSAQSLGQIYHLVNPQAVHVEDLSTWLRSWGYSIETLPYGLWREKLIQQARRLGHDSTLAVAPLFFVGISENAPSAEFHRKDTLDGLGTLILSQYADISIRFNCRNAASALADTSIVCPVVDAEIFGNYLSFFVRSGFLPEPQPGDPA